MNQYTQNFLEALLFGNCWEYSDIEEGECSIYDFTEGRIEEITQFIYGFIDFLNERGIDIVESERSFGGNVFWSLSGHGVGFWDNEETEHLQPLLEEYAGSRYKFESANVFKLESGNIDF